MKKIELLSPVGDFECLKAAVQNGANCVYLGASSFNARARATNFDLETLKKAIQYAKLRNVSVNLTLNTLIKNEEFDSAVELAIKAYNFGVDAIIVQDLGLAKYLLTNYPEIPIHASTQMTIHNLAGVKQLENLGFSRVVLARELSIEEISYIRQNTSIELEVFVHGALCISYSGQCLMSSMIGGRSGNRGLCAQPCRLPYELCSSESTLDKGYLLSPRDNCGIEYLPELIKMGIDSFKIEGRMKTPAYVATVTKIYRKYIDFILDNLELENDVLKSIIKEKMEEKNLDTGLSDKEELAQVFNRGGFSTGHFSPLPNKNLIYKEKPSNMGIYIGTIHNFNQNKGHITLKLEAPISIGDKLSINDNLYTISELMINNQNFENVDKGKIVKIGRMKGNLFVGNKIFKIESSKLIKSISPTYKEDKEFRKISINGKISIKKDNPILLSIYSNDGFYKDLNIVVSSESIPEPSVNKPLTEDDVLKQIRKTGNTQFIFKKLEIDLEENLFVPKTVLNELRRKALEEFENMILHKYSHNLSFWKTDCVNNFQNDTNSRKTISVLLNILDKNIDYTKLENVTNIYIPLKYFFDNSYEDLIKNMSKQFSIYIYLPHIFENKKIENLNLILDKILESFNIKGFVISHISQIPLIEKYNLELIGNFNLNIYNKNSIEALKDLNLRKITLSPELEEDEISKYMNDSNFEILTYGKIPLMTNHYCFLGKSNKCYSSCDKKCLSDKPFYLRDRKGFEFRIIPDNTSCITTIFHNKPICLENINQGNIRIDILDEDFETIQNIINKY